MRISTSTLFSENVASMDQNQSKMLYTQQQISSGRRILTPADDPAAAARALQLTQTDAINTQYLSNIGTTTDAVSLSEGVLQGATTLLQNIQTTAVQAGNASLANSDRQALASTLQDNLNQLMSIANSTDAVGNYLFSGFKANTQPFVNSVDPKTGQPAVQYQGDNGQRMIQVSSNEQLAASDAGAHIFMNIKNGNGTFTTSASSTIQVSGTNVMTGAAAPLTPITFSGAPANNATFNVDGTAVVVNTDVTVAGTGTGQGTLAAAIQAGLTAAGLTSYSVSAAAVGGLQITHTGSTTAVAITGANANASGNGIVNSAGTTGIAIGQTAGSNVLAGATGAAAYDFSLPGQNATFTVNGTPVTVNTPVTVTGTGTGSGTLAAAIQAGLTAAGLTSYSVSTAAAGGLQITNNGSSTAVAIAGVTDPSGNVVAGSGTAGIAELPNTGSGVISIGSTSNPPPTAAQLGNSYQITFNGSGTFNISGIDATGAPLPVGTNTLPTPSTNVPYTSGQSISFNGIQLSITGTPASGDRFVVQPSANESVFTTIQHLITTLKTGVVAGNSASSAQMTAGVSTALNNLSNGLNSVLAARASMGSRLNALTALNTAGTDLGTQFKQTLSQLQDVDYNKAITDLTQQQTMLQAAQKSFLQIENLSVFNYMR